MVSPFLPPVVIPARSNPPLSFLLYREYMMFCLGRFDSWDSVSFLPRPRKRAFSPFPSHNLFFLFRLLGERDFPARRFSGKSPPLLPSSDRVPFIFFVFFFAPLMMIFEMAGFFPPAERASDRLEIGFLAPFGRA